MKLQPESKKELTRIACGTAICTAVMWVIFAALHLVGWVKFDYTVVLGQSHRRGGGHRQLCGHLHRVPEDHRRAGRKTPQSDIAGFLQCPDASAGGVDHRVPSGHPLPALCQCSAPAFPARYDLLPANNGQVQASCTGRAFGGCLCGGRPRTRTGAGSWTP